MLKQWIRPNALIRNEHYPSVFLYKTAISRHCWSYFLARISLTQLPLDKTAAISQTSISNAINFLKWKRSILTKVSLKLVPKVPIDNNLELVLIMAWCRLAPFWAIMRTNADTIHWHIYAALGGDELILWGHKKMVDNCRWQFQINFLWMKFFGFREKCHWNTLFLEFQVTTNQGMMTSSNGNIFRVAGHLFGEFNSYRWIPKG